MTIEASPQTARTTVRKRRVVIMLDLDWPYRRQLELFEGIHEYAATHAHWECSLLPIAEMVSGEAEYPVAGASLACDGIITRVTTGLVAGAKEHGIAMVNVWRNSPVEGVATVAPDYGLVGRLAARHLASCGLQHLGYLGFRRDRACREEYFAQREAAAAVGATSRRLLVRTSYNRNAERWNEFQSQLHEWIAGFAVPFGVHAVSDVLARYVVEACLQRGLRVPEDAAVIGTGDDLPICLQPSPKLSSVECGYKRVGYRAAEALDLLMAGRKLPENEILLDTVRVVPRNSTDVFAVDDPLVAEALRYISNHSHEPINVGDVVNHVPTSRRSLERRFTHVLSRSVRHEINRMRVLHLERLLVDSDEPMEVLANLCGFSDTAQMRRNFLRIRGTTPSAFREAFRP